MNPCPNCGSELVFDIATQKLKCPYCDSVFSPEQIAAGKAAEEAHYNAQTAPPVENGTAADIHVASPQPGNAQVPGQDSYSFDVIAYTCPQCGGSIYATEESVNGFCSYCGSSLMLQARMSKMPKPRKIVPFRVQKEQCKQSFQDHVKKSYFAPKEFRDAEFLENFRGIYMPYWIYDVSRQGNVNMRGKKSYRRGNYIYTENYNCTATVDAAYYGLSYDASAAFDDHFSEGIAPFDAHAMIDFNENYLSGFYADMPDVYSQVYAEDALSFGAEQIFKNIKDSHCFPGVDLEAGAVNAARPNLEGGAAYPAFLPVWFLAFRKKDRVAYAVVNGQTGKIVSDLPVDTKKFFLSAALMAVVFYLILALFPAMTPVTLLSLATIITTICTALLVRTIDKVRIRDRRLDDKGYLSKYNTAAFQESQMKGRKPEKKSPGITLSKLIPLILIFGVQFGFSALAAFVVLLGNGLLSFVSAVIMLVLVITGFKKSGEGMQEGRTGIRIGLLVNLITVIFAVFLMIVRPPSDYFYYGSAFVMMASTIACQLLSLSQYNLLTTHPLPQLNRRGGDDSAPV